MSKISFLIAFSLLSLILHKCAESSKESQDAGISGIVYDETETKLKQYLQNGNMLSAFKSLITKVFAKGITKGIATGIATGIVTGRAEGIAEGYQMADSKNFLNYFHCAVSNSKVDLEVYKGDTSKVLYKKKPEPISPTTNGGKWIPSDIEREIIRYDAWMPYYDALPISNGDPIVNPPTYFLPDSFDKFLNEITKVSKNWYLIVTCPYGRMCPSYVIELQNHLKNMQQHNRKKYNTEEEIFRRFAVHMARSHKMMCVLYHKIFHFMDKFASDSLKELSDVLFECVPSFHISSEQLYFLNVLRSTIHANAKPLQYYSATHKLGNIEHWTIIPFDNSTRCLCDNLRKISISTTLIPTFTPTSSSDPV